MRLSLCLLVAYITSGAAALGLRTAYEKVFLFYAWQIDQLNPDDQRTIGVKCAEPIHRTKGGCKDPELRDKKGNEIKPPPPKYLPCTARDRTRDPVTHAAIDTWRRCKNLREFMAHIDDAKYDKRNPIPGGPNAQDDLTPDVDATAKNINQMNMDRNRYPAWRVIKDGTEFNKMIDDVASVVANTKGSLTQADYDANRSQFEGVKKSLMGVKDMRYIDHSYYLIEHLKQQIPGIDIKSRPAGFTQQVKGPDNTLKEVESVEFLRQKTIDENRAAIPDIEDRMKAVYDNYYSTDESAKEHRTVMQSFEMALNRIEGTSCST